MTPTSAARLIDEVGKLWPRRVADGKDPHPWTEAAQDVYHEALCSDTINLTSEQGVLVVQQLKREGEYVPNDAGWRKLLERLRQLSAKSQPARHHDSQATPETLDSPIQPLSPAEWGEANRDKILACYEQRCDCEKSQQPYDRFPDAPELSARCARCQGSMTGRYWHDRMSADLGRFSEKPAAQFAGNLDVINTVRRIVGKRELRRG